MRSEKSSASPTKSVIVLVRHRLDVGDAGEGARVDFEG